MSHLEKLESKMEELSMLKKDLMSCLKTEFAKGIHMMDTKEAGEVVDMIKDLAETEKLCYEAEYYKTVIEAMEEKDEESEKYGYRRSRNSMGRFTLSGGRKGYRPYIDQMPYVEGYLDDPDFEESMRTGYTSGQGGSSGQNRSTDGRSGTYSGGVRRGFTEDSDWDDRGGKAYNEYKNYRRYYTTSHSSSDKAEMEKHMKEHINSTLETMKEMYETAEPELKKKMKSDFTKLVNEMM